MKFKYAVVLAGAISLATIYSSQHSVSANAVNDYISGRNYTPGKAQNNIQQWLNNPNWEGVNMNYRHGKPEGVLVHETANSSDKTNPNAIWDEINYMLQHADSAFVHSFVNQDGAVEIANSDYLAWGAGAAGNARFIQTEQVQVNSKEAFAHELFNLAVLQAEYLAKHNLKPELGKTVWSHSMVSHQLGGTNHTDPDGYWADMAARYFGSTYTMNDYQALLQKVYNQIAVKPAKYAVGQKVQLYAGALNTVNGDSIKNMQGWVGTVKSVQQKSYSVSQWQYTIEFKSGTTTYTMETILEQDLQKAPEAKYWVGARMALGNGALNASDGKVISGHRGWTGALTSVSLNNLGSSHYQYSIKYDNGQSDDGVLEQDFAVLPSQYKVGQQVQLNSGALNAANGSDLKAMQGWVGTIKSITQKTYSTSFYQYKIEFKSGKTTKTVDTVLEHDFHAFNTLAAYKVGDQIAVVPGANASAAGENITGNVGWIGKITGVSLNNLGSSNYTYTVSFSSGNKTVTVADILQQDLTKSLPAALYKVGSRVVVTEGALNAADGASISKQRNKFGTVTSVKQTNLGSSAFAYNVKFDDGTTTNLILQQDLLVAPDNSKYRVGSSVKLTNGALNTLDGTSIAAAQGWVGTVQSVTYKKYSVSDYIYKVKFQNGVKSVVYDRILEQDLTTPQAASFANGARVQVTEGALNAADNASLVSRQDTIGTISAVTTNNLGHSNFAYTVKFDNSGSVANILEQDLRTAPVARYKVGQTVSVGGGALNEFNGTSLRDHQRWIGTVQAVTPKTYSTSKFMYKIAFKSGTGTITHNTVLEQDIADVPQSEFGVNSRIQVADSANATADGKSLVSSQSKLGTVTAVTVNNLGWSQYAYTVKFDDGSTIANILQQDLLQAPGPAKYQVGQSIQLAAGVLDALNGTSLRDKQGWIGTVKSVTPKRCSVSNYMYEVTFTNGTKTVTVSTILEQDIQNPVGNTFAMGTRVKVNATATGSASGASIVAYQGQSGVITKVAINNLGWSQYAYDVRLDNGVTIPAILQQDLTRS